ncbi:hypothetical protein [Roseovarius aestuariivivens]|uniref:hypothetical protein n=1 Tax=Roseovarius aestuariivivens TaxID=1888910 RepID=UPI0010800CB3|nr:hypothetical protein [Roseovarius aestuariivivens]
MSAHARFSQYDWSRGTAEEQLALARTGTDAQLRDLALRYDWNGHPQHVLGWIMAQKCIDLGTALSVFFNGQPERFNYLPKREVPEALRGAASVLDTICLRLNSGFYLVWPDRDVTDRLRVEGWLRTQADDRQTGRKGRFVLDETIVSTLLNNELSLDPRAETAVYCETSSLWRDIFSPVLELGVSRRVLRYKPQNDDDDDLSKLHF